MAGTKIIKTRIKSTKNIKQITKAMEAVSAVKMRRSEIAAIGGRAFAIYSLGILKKLEESAREENEKVASPLLSAREIKRSTLVVIASDKGLAGAFNANVLRAADIFISNSVAPVSLITVGKRARDHAVRKGYTILESYEAMGDMVELKQAEQITERIISLFRNDQTDSIDIIYTNFVSAIKQEVKKRPLLPLNEKAIEEVIESIIPRTGKFSELRAAMAEDTFEYIFEPSKEEAFKALIPILLEIEIFHSILEANASEHAARMVAMKNASDNAGDVISSLTLLYNKERQAQITKELIEITSGKEALEASNN